MTTPPKRRREQMTAAMHERSMSDASDTAASRTAEIVLDEWAKQHRQRSADSVGGINRQIERRYRDFKDRMHAVASLIIAVTPLLAASGRLTEAEYQEHLQHEMRRLLPFFDGSVRKILARRLIVAHAMQNDIEADPTLADEDGWPGPVKLSDQVPSMELGAPGQEMKKLLASNKKEISSTMLEYAETFRATEITCDEWAKQDWPHPADGARGVKHLIEQHYPDFHDRMRRLAYLMIRVAPLLATPGYTTEAEYRGHLQDEMRKLLPFLTEPVRQDVAAALLVVHATHKDDAYIEDPRLISID